MIWLFLSKYLKVLTIAPCDAAEPWQLGSQDAARLGIKDSWGGWSITGETVSNPGRAGRYGSLFPNGEVTCMSEEDLCLLRSSLKAPSPYLKAAGLFPSFDILALYSRLHPEYTFYSVLEQFVEKAKLSSNYFLSDCEDIMNAAAVIEDLPLGLQERYIFCISPVDIKDNISAQGLIQFAEAYAKKGRVHLQEIFTPETLRIPKTHNALIELESIHKVLDLYVWLGFHFEESFPDREVASSQKALCG
ncbi:hypothetical protein KI387_039349, partial [Taxus chinensis]